MYGTVNSLSETMQRLGLAKKPTMRLVEDKDESSVQDEKDEKKRLIQEARKTSKKGSLNESKKSSAKKGTRLSTLLEEVEAVANELEDLKTADVAETDTDTDKNGDNKELSRVVASLDHVSNFASEAKKKFEWRKDERSQSVTALFTVLREEAEKLIAKIKKGELSEESTVRAEANPLIKRFVEGVGYVKEAFKINKEVYEALKENLKNVK